MSCPIRFCARAFVYLAAVLATAATLDSVGTANDILCNILQTESLAVHAGVSSSTVEEDDVGVAWCGKDVRLLAWAYGVSVADGVGVSIRAADVAGVGAGEEASEGEDGGGTHVVLYCKYSLSAFRNTVIERLLLVDLQVYVFFFFLR